MNPKIVVSLPIDFYAKLRTISESNGVTPQLQARLFIIEKIKANPANIENQIVAEWSAK